MTTHFSSTPIRPKQFSRYLESMTFTRREALSDEKECIPANPDL
jgi:hypothetical protein